MNKIAGTLKNFQIILEIYSSITIDTGGENCRFLLDFAINIYP